MKIFKEKKQHRYKGYNYSLPGAYFVTICTWNKQPFFGDMINGGMVLSEVGLLADRYLREIPDHFPFIKLDEHIIMPDHVHGIIWILENSGNSGESGSTKFCVPTSRTGYQNKFGPQSKNLSSIIRGFKIGVTKYAKINDLDFAWQSRFYDRIIRNDAELDRIRLYIRKNPANWEREKNRPENFNKLFNA